MFDSRKYYKTVEFLLFKALNELYPSCKPIVHHSIQSGEYIRLDSIHGGISGFVNPCLITSKIKEYILDEIPITTTPITSFTEGVRDNEFDKLFSRVDTLKTAFLHKCDGFERVGLDEVYSNTSDVALFEIVAHRNGIILRTPKKVDDNIVIPDTHEDWKLTYAYNSQLNYLSLFTAERANDLHEKVDNNTMCRFIVEVESDQEMRINNIASSIRTRVINNDLKFIAVSGASSSGKTTFSNKLKESLESDGTTNIIMLSLDDYYVNREDIPLDKDGIKDFETLYSLDVGLLNSNLRDLERGLEVEIPIYDFKTGMRKEVGRKLKMGRRDLILFEGIHGMNPKLIEGIASEHIYKIYVSCLNCVKVTDTHRVRTTMVRLMRRVVRDNLSRGFSADVTLEMWKRVRRGESIHIFPYQNEADVVFNTSLAYEIGVLKPHFLNSVEGSVSPLNPNFNTISTLLRYLEYFPSISSEDVPKDSLLREFIGGSKFYSY